MKEAEERARENLASTSWLVVVLCRSCAVTNKSRCLWLGAGIDNRDSILSMVQAGCDLFMELR